MALLRKFQRSKRRDAVHPVLSDIVENLNNILNTKKDYGSFLPDFGIRDLNEYSSRAAIAEAVIEEVHESIRLFEPRVAVDSVTLVPDANPLHLAFKIQCTVLSNTRALRLVLDTVFNTYHVDAGSGGV